MPLRIGADTRAAFFDEPLAQVLEDCGCAELIGGQTWWAEGKPASATLEIGLDGLSTETLDVISETLNALGAPRTSTLETEDGDLLRPFGLVHLFCLRLAPQDHSPGTGQPSDLENVFGAANAALGPYGSFQGGFRSLDSLNLYFVGMDPVAMENTLWQFVKTHQQTPDGTIIRLI